MPSFSMPLDGGQDDLAHGTGMDLGRHDRRRRIGAHAAGVGSLVAVHQALVVLAGRQPVTFLPSHSTMKLASSPWKNSSITTRAPPSLCARPACHPPA